MIHTKRPKDHHPTNKDCFLQVFPPDIQHYILSFLHQRDLLNLAMVSKNSNAILWKKLDITELYSVPTKLITGWIRKNAFLLETITLSVTKGNDNVFADIVDEIEKCAKLVKHLTLNEFSISERTKGSIMKMTQLETLYFPQSVFTSSTHLNFSDHTCLTSLILPNSNDFSVILPPQIRFLSCNRGLSISTITNWNLFNNLTHLNILGCHITDEMMKQLSFVKLRDLSIDTSELSSIFIESSVLVRLQLANIDDKSLSIISPSLLCMALEDARFYADLPIMKCPNLHVLNVLDSHISKFSECVLQDCPSLNQLQYVSNDAEYPFDLITSEPNSINYSTAITYLEVFDDQFHFAAIECLHNLEKLKVEQYNRGYWGRRFILNFPKLQYLHLNYFQLVDSTISGLPNLKRVILESCIFVGSSYRDLCSNAPNIEYLKLIDCEIDQEIELANLKSLVLKGTHSDRIIYQNLKTLDITGTNKITVSVKFPWILKHTSLTDLRIKDLSLELNEIKPLPQLCFLAMNQCYIDNKMLLENQTYLSTLIISDVTPHTFSHLTEHAPNIETLGLQNCDSLISSELNDYIRSSPTLKKLQLYKCNKTLWESCKTEARIKQVKVEVFSNHFRDQNPEQQIDEGISKYFNSY